MEVCSLYLKEGAKAPYSFYTTIRTLSFFIILFLDLLKKVTAGHDKIHQSPIRRFLTHRYDNHRMFSVVSICSRPSLSVLILRQKRKVKHLVYFFAIRFNQSGI